MNVARYMDLDRSEKMTMNINQHEHSGVYKMNICFNAIIFYINNIISV